MDWSRPVDLYCERTDPSFWAEPVNALTNAAFLIVAAIALVQWRRAGTRDWPSLILIGLTATIGVGSFIFHTFATSAAVWFDVVPISAFIYLYLCTALRRFLSFSLFASLAILIGFALFGYAEARIVPAGALNGSHTYLPAFAALLIVTWFVPVERSRRLMLAAAGLLAVSLFFRSVDIGVCDTFPLGTHFLWHSLNAVVLYLLLRGAMSATRQTYIPP